MSAVFVQLHFRLLYFPVLGLVVNRYLPGYGSVSIAFVIFEVPIFGILRFLCCCSYFDLVIFTKSSPRILGRLE